MALTSTGSARFSSDVIAQATGLKVGDAVTRDDMQRAADTLARLGTFSSVQYRYTSVEQGVKIEYQVKDAPALPVSFDNFPWFTDDVLTAELKNSVVLFDGTAPERGAILDQMALALEKLIERRGVFGSVTHALVTALPDNHEVMEFKVEGAAADVERVEFSDALAQNDRGIQDRFSDLVGKPFSRSAIEAFEVEQVRPEYLARGYLRVKFEPPKASFVPTANEAHPSKITVLAPVDPGIAYSWGGVTWIGTSAIPPTELDKLIDLKPGDVADGMKIEGLWEKVRVAFARQGYLDLVLQPTSDFDDVAKRVAYTAAIQEGPQYHMGKLVLTGLSLEGERRIRTAWAMAPGSVFNEGAYEDFLDNGIKRAFSGFPAHYEKIGRFLQRDPNAATVDVLIDFQ